MAGRKGQGEITDRDRELRREERERARRRLEPAPSERSTAPPKPSTASLAVRASAGRSRALAIASLLRAITPALAILALAAVLGGSSGERGGSPSVALAAPPLGPPPSYPWEARIAEAERRARSRRGLVSFAAIDEKGRLVGRRVHVTYPSASTVKALFLVTYLNQASVRDRPLGVADRRLLSPMVKRSDNRTASRVRNLVGNAAVMRQARGAGMTDFSIAPIWGNSRISAADLVRLFVAIDGLVPARHRAYARELLAGVVPSQRWGIAPAKPPGFAIFFKGGWSPRAGPWVVNQGALLERDRRRLAVAVMTYGSRSYAYGRETIRSVAARLLRDYR